MRACLAGALVAVLCLCGTASAAAPKLVVKGPRLVDARTGKTFVPRGVNWPSFEYACYYGYDYSDAGDPTTTHPTATQARRIASWHVNTVRVPLNEACWLGVDGQPAFGDVAGYRAAVRSWVSTLNRAGLAVILDLHWSAPPGVGAEGQRAHAGRAARTASGARSPPRSSATARSCSTSSTSPTPATTTTAARLRPHLGLLARRRLHRAGRQRRPAARRQHVHRGRHAGLVDAVRDNRRHPADHARRARLRERPRRVAREPPVRRPARRELPQLQGADLPHGGVLEPHDRARSPAASRSSPASSARRIAATLTSTAT